MSRIRDVVFSEGVLFEEQTHGFIFPVNDLLPLYGPVFQANEPEPAKFADPNSILAPVVANRTHVYSDCYAGFGRWEISQIMVTNPSPNVAHWGVAKYPSSTYKDAGSHAFTRYTGVTPTALDAVSPRFYSVLYWQPLQPFQTYVTPTGFSLVVQAGESLWGQASPSWPWAVGLSGPGAVGLVDVTIIPMVTIRITGDIVV